MSDEIQAFISAMPQKEQPATEVAEVAPEVNEEPPQEASPPEEPKSKAAKRRVRWALQIIVYE